MKGIKGIRQNHDLVFPSHSSQSSLLNCFWGLSDVELAGEVVVYHVDADLLGALLGVLELL